MVSYMVQQILEFKAMLHFTRSATITLILFLHIWLFDFLILFAKVEALTLKFKAKVRSYTKISLLHCFNVSFLFNWYLLCLKTDIVHEGQRQIFPSG